MTYTQTEKATQSKSAVKSPCGCGGDCGCHQGPPKTDCCSLTCFERPKYFCGHLLSDADLTLEQNYVREKNRLYHRTIDGTGVVCGLRLTCDSRCEGHVNIGAGYAIDCCGNDLIVCEPNSYDVLGELRSRKWVLEEPEDPCKKRGEPAAPQEPETGNQTPKDPEDCLGKQCFYIGLCYQETPAEYVTPFQTDCSPAPGSCQPTRIREGVSIELYQEMPKRPNPLDEIECRIERCFRVFREGQFSKGLESLAPHIIDILKPSDPAITSNQQEQLTAAQAYCRLRALFLRELDACPDRYNCDIKQLVWNIDQPVDNSDYANVAPEAFQKLLELIQRHVFSCVLAEFAFLCPTPPESCCVLIGSVEVEHGRITRVLNYPRWYLWCFANFFEVLMYTLANEVACGDKKYRRTNDESRQISKSNGCCPTFEVDVLEFLNVFVLEKRATEYAVKSPVQLVRNVLGALIRGIDYVKPGGLALQAFVNKPPEKAQMLADVMHFKLDHAGTAAAKDLDFVTAALSSLVYRGDLPLALFESTGEDAVVTQATAIMQAPASRSVGESDLEQRVTALEEIVKNIPSVSGKKKDVSPDSGKSKGTPDGGKK